MTVNIDLTDAEWDALEGWREAAQENAESDLGASGLDAVRWAEQEGLGVPADVDWDAAENWLYYHRMKARVGGRRVTEDDMRALHVYGEALSMDELAEDSVDRALWEKTYDLARNPRGGLLRGLATAGLALLGVAGLVMGARARREAKRA